METKKILFAEGFLPVQFGTFRNLTCWDRHLITFSQEFNFLCQSISFFFIILGIYNFAWSMEAKGIGVCKKRSKCNQEPSHVF